MKGHCEENGSRESAGIYKIQYMLALLCRMSCFTVGSAIKQFIIIQQTVE